MTAILPGVGPGCTVALGGQLVGNNGLTECLVTSALLPVIQTGNSLVLPLEEWLETMCPLKPCDQWALDGAKTAITRDCGPERKDPVGLVNTIYNALQNYPTVRRVLCDKSDTAETPNHLEYCVPQILHTIENTTGVVVTSDWVQHLLAGDAPALADVSSAIASRQLCTPCWSHFLAETATLPGAAQGLAPVTNATNATCGPDFIQSPNATLATVPAPVDAASPSPSSSASAGFRGGLATASLGAAAAAVLVMTCVF